MSVERLIPQAIPLSGDAENCGKGLRGYVGRAQPSYMKVIIRGPFI
jgi:hypothetical protein